jgi:hypothetical protein
MGIITVHNAALGVYPAFLSTSRESPVSNRSYTSSSSCSSTNPSQDQHEGVAEQDLVGAKWQLQATHLTQTLSYKTLKNNHKSLAPSQIDRISRYDVPTDSLSEEKLEAVAESFDVFDGQSLVSKQDHYQPLAKFLNNCLDNIPTNHLFLPEESIPYGDSQQDVKDYRAQWVHVTKFSGESLEKVKTPRMLIKGIVHAILGNFCACLMDTTI